MPPGPRKQRQIPTDLAASHAAYMLLPPAELPRFLASALVEPVRTDLAASHVSYMLLPPAELPRFLASALVGLARTDHVGLARTDLAASHVP